jgi:hypothetical protein
MAYPKTVNLLPENKVLVITADALASGELIWQDSTESAVTIGASTVQRFGPFDIPRQYTLTHTAGTLVDALEATTMESGQVGMQCNLTTIPATANLTIPTDSQVIIDGTFTVLGSLDVDGSLVVNS